VHNKGRLIIGGSAFLTKDKYYLTRDFSQSDTADQTTFKGISSFIEFERSTLNMKMYANEGTYFDMRIRYINGNELTQPGNSGILRDTISTDQKWLQLRVVYDNYFKRIGIWKIGFYNEMEFSSQPFFSNHTASLAAAPSFQPIADMQTQFLDAYRAYNYIGFGFKNVLSVSSNLDVRLEGYMFQPFQEILQDANYKAQYGDAFGKRYFIASLNPVYHSPFGPVSVSLNYYDKRDKPLSFMIHLGYVLFNKKPLN
jgi:NTE family protein